MDSTITPAPILFCRTVVHPPDRNDFDKDLPELVVMATELSQAHSQNTVRAAALVQLATSLLTSYGHTRKADVEPLIHLLNESVSLWCRANSVEPSAIKRVIQALQQAGETARYIHSLPD